MYAASTTFNNFLLNKFQAFRTVPFECHSCSIPAMRSMPIDSCRSSLNLRSKPMAFALVCLRDTTRRFDIVLAAAFISTRTRPRKIVSSFQSRVRMKNSIGSTSLRRCSTLTIFAWRVLVDSAFNLFPNDSSRACPPGSINNRHDLN